MESFSSQGEKRDFAKKIGVEWEEYLRFRRKWKRVLDRWKNEKM